MSPRLPDEAVRAELAAFYRTSVGYADQQATHGPAYFSRLLTVMDAVLVGTNPHVLEIGAGSAAALIAFLESRRGARGVAVELSDVSLHRATAGRSSALRGVAGSALAIPLRDGSVDAVVAFEVLEHLPDVARALDEALRVLRRPGYLIIGLPNHASLWTPVADAWKRRSRRAFGVERGRGAWRWWRRNAALTWRKRVLGDTQFLYRRPILDNDRSGDADAVYYAAPIDLLRFLERRGARLVTSSARVRLGPIGGLVPVELQGSTVLAWRVT